MKIAIIGGGASGMASAYWLDQQGHQVSIFERASSLGGHIRTLNRNVSPQTPCSEILEAGVLEFPTEFTHFLHLMQELNVPLEPVSVGSGLFFLDGRHFLSPVLIDHNFQGFKKWQEVLHIDGLYARSAGLWLKAHLTRPDSLKDQSLSAFLDTETTRATWVKLLTMYSYSMPYDTIDHFPAELAIPSLQRYIFSHWVRIKGGVYSYIEKILSRFSGEVNLNASITNIHRSKSNVTIQGKIGDTPQFCQVFDTVIFATPPDQVLQLLSDPRPEEVRRFQNWQPNYATTAIHCDRKCYKPYGIQQGSEFDFFQTDSDWGYNAYLNQLCGISSSQSYHLAFRLLNATINGQSSVIDPEKILHIQEHHTPFYTIDAFRYRDEVIEHNGDYRTYHVGAYLRDGLHEGAIASAKTVVELLHPQKVEAISGA